MAQRWTLELCRAIGVACAIVLAPAGAPNWIDVAQAQSAALSNFPDVVERVKPAVVGVRAKIERETGETDSSAPKGSPSERFMQKFGLPSTEAPRRLQRATSQGSGFFISADGYVVTTSHVVEGAKTVEVTLDDGKTKSARVVGADDKTDIALLKVEGEGFSFVRLATNAPRIGEWVLAIGNPFGLGGTVTAGIVSARARDIKMGGFNDFIQIDAPVNQGNSGGPTFDVHGNVIGVNSAIFSPTGGSIGIGFAIPAEAVVPVVTRLKQSGAVIRGWLGIQIQSLTAEIAEGFGLTEAKGVIVAEPEPNSPAAKASLATGDVIISVNGEAVTEDRALMKRIGDIAPGTSVTLEVLRNGERRSIAVTLGEMPGPRNPAAMDAKAERREAPARSDGGSLGAGSSGARSLGAASPVPGTPSARSLGLELAPANGKTGGNQAQGVTVTDMDPNGIAAERGIEPGDVILDVGGKATKAPADVETALSETRTRGKRNAVARVKSSDATRFVALPVD